MMIKKKTKIIHAGHFVAEVNLIQSDDEWAPYLSVEDATKLDDVRETQREDM